MCLSLFRLFEEGNDEIANIVIITWRKRRFCGPERFCPFRRTSFIQYVETRARRIPGAQSGTFNATGLSLPRDKTFRDSVLPENKIVLALPPSSPERVTSAPPLCFLPPFSPSLSLCFFLVFNKSVFVTARTPRRAKRRAHSRHNETTTT